MTVTTQVPALRFAEFEGQWINSTIGAIGDVITGSTPATNNETFYGNNLLFVSPIDIQSNRYVHETKTTLTQEGFNKGRKIKKGSSLFVCIGSTIGKVGQAANDCITNQQINSIVPRNNDQDFVFSLLQYHSSKISVLAAEQAVPIINKKTFSNYELRIRHLSPVTCPPLPASSILKKLSLQGDK